MRCPAWTPSSAPGKDTYLKEGSWLLSAGGRVPPGLQGFRTRVPGLLWGTWLPGLGGRALAAAVPAVPPGASAAAPWGDLAWPHWLMAGARAEKCWSGEGPRALESGAGGHCRRRVGWAGAARVVAELAGAGTPGSHLFSAPGDALHLEGVLSPRGCECVLWGTLSGRAQRRLRTSVQEPALRQLCQWL